MKLVPSDISSGEQSLREAFAASLMVKEWKMILYPVLSDDSGYLEVAEPSQLLRKLWLTENTRLKTTLWKNMPESVVECWKGIRKNIIGIPTVIFEHNDGDMVVVQKLDFLRDPNAVKSVIRSSNYLMSEMPTFFFTEQELANDPHEVLAWVLRATHDTDTPSVIQLGGRQFVISK